MAQSKQKYKYKEKFVIEDKFSFWLFAVVFILNFAAAIARLITGQAEFIWVVAAIAGTILGVSGMVRYSDFRKVRVPLVDPKIDELFPEKPTEN